MDPSFFMDEHDPMSFPLIRDLLVARAFHQDQVTQNTATGGWVSQPTDDGHGRKLPPVFQSGPSASGFSGSPVSAEREGERRASQDAANKAGGDQEAAASTGAKAGGGEGRPQQWISDSGELVVDGGVTAKWDTCVVVEGMENCWSTLRQDLVDIFDIHRVCGEAVVFGDRESHLILVYLWTSEGRETAILDLNGAIIEKTTTLRVRPAEQHDLQRALEMQKAAAQR